MKKSRRVSSSRLPTRHQTQTTSNKPSQLATHAAINSYVSSSRVSGSPSSRTIATRSVVTNASHSRRTPVTTQSRRTYTPPSLSDVGKTNFNIDVRLVLLGAPGSGKGSFSKYISHYFDIPMISTGDLIRAEVKAETPIGLKVKEISQRGELVGDDVVIGLLQKRIQEPDTRNGYILDGFPRTLEQAKTLDVMGQREVFKTPNAVLNINLREDVLIKKACARRICGDCGTGYNLADIREPTIYMPSLPPKQEGVCDKCTGALIQRADDNEATVLNRLRIYQEHAQPLLDYYAQQGILLRWDVHRGLDDTYDVLKIIEESLTPEQVRASL